MKEFEMTHLTLTESAPVHFNEETAPDWLTSVNTVKGSTRDIRWFWVEHVLTLEVGCSVKTDFREITRVK